MIEYEREREREREISKRKAEKGRDLYISNLLHIKTILEYNQHNSFYSYTIKKLAQK